MSNPKPVPAPTPAKILETATKVGRIATQARDGVTALQPLLALLEEPEGDRPSPIEELRQLLEAVLLSQRQLHLLVTDVSNRVDALAGRRKPSPSTVSAGSSPRA
ncbi:hypothetical protein GCM10011390_51230 [Aureimonas endophytica]|uniref:Uncharacterized protein n=1 Tax=Aureimonas endophytica TaxID=2027858 RepID=A0A917ED27_9HYPH|nr:hypothetical protein GCM10011390_51230 [Aureimonas endophytica]